MSSRTGLDRLVVATVPRDVVIISGPEAELYLQGQISADVAALESGESTLSFLLEPRGRIEALFVISRTDPNTFVADTEPGFGEEMTTSLARFKLRTKVEFTPQQWTMHAVRGPQAASESTTRAAATGPADAPEHVVRPTLWPHTSGYDMLVRPGGVVSQSDGAQQISTDEFEALRMAYGLPAMGSEIQPGDIPNETGLVERAASFTKGCYRGQELVERIDSRTGGRRSVCRLRAGVPLAPGDELHDGAGTAVATVLSAAALDDAVVGFALARRDAAAGAFTSAAQPVELADLF